MNGVQVKIDTYIAYLAFVRNETKVAENRTKTWLSEGIDKLIKLIPKSATTLGKVTSLIAVTLVSTT